MPRRTLLLLVVLLLSLAKAGAQTYRHRAEVGTVAEPGFYRIQLPPAVMGHLNPRQSDLRLLNGQGREIPYFVEREEAVQRKSRFREYELVEKTSQPKEGTTVVLSNPDQTPINNISLLIKNAKVEKRAQLSGSNDARSWYVIDDQIWLRSLYSTAATAELKILDFPLSDYAYYKLDIRDSASAPLNIVRAGYYATSTESGQYSEVTDLAVRRKDSAEVKKTFLFFSFPQLPVLDKLQLQISGPAHFRRQATLLAEKTEENRRGLEETVWRPVTSFLLSSEEENQVLLPAVRARKLMLVIENEDNPPLQLAQVRLLQRNTYLVAELQPSTEYHLLFGSGEAAVPAYDLAYFREKVPAAVPVLQPGPVQPNPALAVAAPAPAGGLSQLLANELVIWSALLLVIGFLAVMSFRMLQERRG